MTEDEAKQHWCPFVQVTSGSFGQAAFSNRLQTARVNGGMSNRCLASECMAWRWASEPTDGVCGLAGKP